MPFLLSVEYLYTGPSTRGRPWSRLYSTLEETKRKQRELMLTNIKCPGYSNQTRSFIHFVPFDNRLAQARRNAGVNPKRSDFINKNRGNKMIRRHTNVGKNGKIYKHGINDRVSRL